MATSSATTTSLHENNQTSTSTNIPPPRPLNIHDAPLDNWKLFKQTWKNYNIITQLNTKDEEFKKAMFLHCIGNEALQLINSFSFSDDCLLKDIIDSLDSYFLGTLNETYERFKFNQRRQNEENIDTFVTSLKTLAKTCNFCNCIYDSLIRDRIVIGIESNATQKRLLQEKHLTLQRCIDICKANETSEKQTQDINKPQNSVHFIEPQYRTPQPPSRRCKFCALTHILKKELCPAYNKTCSQCRNKNHFKACCPQLRTHALTLETDNLTLTSNYDEFQPEYLLTINPQDKKSSYINLIMNKQLTKFQIDSGSSVDVLPLRLLTDKDKLLPSDKIIKAYNNANINVLGKLSKTLQNPQTEKQFETNFLVVDTQLPPILGKSTSEKIGILKIDYKNFEHVHSLDTAEKIFTEFPDRFDSIGCLPKPVKLSVKDNSTPTYAKPARLPVNLTSKVKTEIDRLVSQPLIPHEVPTYAWEKVGLDIFVFSNVKYLIVVDYLTDFFEIERLYNETSDTVIRVIKQQFARYGIPEIVISDNGPCFASHLFKVFSQNYDFQHIFSSPHHPQSNGKAENAVKQAKSLLKKSTLSETDPYLGLLELRNTPDPSTGLSPAQKFHCRQLRSIVPSCKQLLEKRSCGYSTIKTQTPNQPLNPRSPLLPTPPRPAPNLTSNNNRPLPSKIPTRTSRGRLVKPPVHYSP